MGIRRGPNIVTDGLVFAVDAANPSSYVSGSSVCKDQTINQNDGTLNSTTFSSANNGFFIFDGTDDTINFGDNESINNVVLGDNPIFTYELWINPDSSTNSTCCGIGKTNGTGHIVFYNYPTGNQFNFNKVSGDTPSTTRTFQVRTTFPHGNWTHYIWCYDGSGSTPSYTSYINGQLGTNTLSANDSTSKIGAGGDNLLMIGERMASGATDYNGELSIMRIYDRILSSTEVTQNYNAMKGRFGL
jgi:hypothetical protein